MWKSPRKGFVERNVFFLLKMILYLETNQVLSQLTPALTNSYKLPMKEVI